MEVRVQGKGKGSPAGKSSSPQGQRIEAERLLEEAASTWGQARDVLEEVKELRALYKQLDSASSVTLSPPQNGKLNSPQQANHQKAWCENIKVLHGIIFSMDSSCWLLYYRWNQQKTNNMSYKCMYELLRANLVFFFHSLISASGGFTKHKLLRCTLRYQFSQWCRQGQ